MAHYRQFALSKCRACGNVLDTVDPVRNWKRWLSQMVVASLVVSVAVAAWDAVCGRGLGWRDALPRSMEVAVPPAMLACTCWWSLCGLVQSVRHHGGHVFSALLPIVLTPVYAFVAAVGVTLMYTAVYLTLELAAALIRVAQHIFRSMMPFIQTTESDRTALPQWRLIWLRFRRSRAAVASGVVLVLLYLSVLFAEFVAPYSANTRFIRHNFCPPQRLQWRGADGIGLQPFVYGVERWVNERNLRRMYRPDAKQVLPVRFFVKGDPYKLWRMFDCERHLFGVETGTIFLLGSDRQGRDLPSRLLMGGRISLTIGLVGVTLSLFLGTTLGVASGYYGGRIDNGIQRTMELIRVFPQIPLWMALSAALPPH